MGGVVWLGERGVGTRLPGWMGELVRVNGWCKGGGVNGLANLGYPCRWGSLGHTGRLSWVGGILNGLT